MKIELSIIIPAYNVEDYIERTLSSVLSQNSGNIEILVINDGSTDRTEQVVRKAIEQSGAYNVTLHSKTNGGVSSARNFGLERSTGEYVYFLDGDDYLADHFIISILDLIGRHKPQVLHWQYDLVDEAGITISRFPYKIETVSGRTGLETLNAILLERSTRIWTGSVAYRRELLMEHSLSYTDGCVVGEDLEFIFMALSYAQSVLFTDTVKTYYVQRSSSVINTYSIRKFDAVLALGRVHHHFFCLNTPEYRLLAKRFDEYEILHYYTGTYRMCLQYLISDRKMSASAAVRQLSREIDRLYPGMREEMSSKMKSRKKKILPDRIDIFRYSPYLYLHLSKLSERLQACRHINEV